MNATSYFQGMMMEVLGNLVGRVCLIYVDGVKVIGRSVEDLVVNLHTVLLRCMERGIVELPAAGRLPRVDVPGCERPVWGVLLDAGAEGGASGRVIFHRHEPRAPRFLEWCVSRIIAVLAHGGQGILRNSEGFSARAVLAVGWLEHLLRSSQLGVHLQYVIVWRDVKQDCVATPCGVACMHELVQIRDSTHSGEDNHWGDLLSRWRVLDSEGFLVRANVIAVVAPPTGNYQMPSKREIKDRQDAVARGQVEMATSSGTVTRGENRLYRVLYQGRMVFWVPHEERELQARLIVCAHMQDAGHCGVRSTVHRLGAYCAWDNMENDIAKFVRQCLHCVDSKSGNALPRPLGDVVHGTAVSDVLHFDYLILEESDATDTGGLVDRDYKHVLVLMDDVSRFVWLEEAVSCSMEVAARSVLKWFASFGVPNAFTSNDGTHFTGQVMQMVSSRLGLVHQFGVANGPGSQWTVQRMNREVVKTFRAVLSERRRPPSEWQLALGDVHWAKIRRTRSAWGRRRSR